MIPSGRKPDHFSVDFRAQMGIMDGIEAKECRHSPLRDARGEIEGVFTLSFCRENDGILLWFFCREIDGILLCFVVKTMGFVVKTMGYYFGLKVGNLAGKDF